jgi:succinate dehydrogenase / fumarate reductase membrane anchor subunit
MDGSLVMVDRRKPAHGFSDWAWQRATAMTMLIYSIVIIVRFVIDPPSTGATAWRAWFAPWMFKALTLLFLWALIYHAWLGVKEILMDYVHNTSLRAKLQMLFGVALAGYVVWATYIIWSVA